MLESNESLPALLARAAMFNAALPLTAMLLSGCAGAPAATACEDAVAALETCAGTAVEAPFTSCTPDEERSALSIIDSIEADGCSGPVGGKADGFFCNYWDPFGWCDEPAAPLGPEPAGVAATYPILLAHGFNTSTTNFWRFNNVDLTLANDGHTVRLGSVPPFDTAEVRAAFLRDQVDQLLADTGAAKVNLICFSQGGLDCRYLASPGGFDYGAKIASVTLLSAANRGTYLGDAFMALVSDPNSRPGRVADTIASWYGETYSDLAADSHFVAAMESLSEGYMVEWNTRVTDHPDVYYQSWAGFSYAGGFGNPNEDIHEVCRDEAGVTQLLWHEGQRDIMDLLLVGGAVLVGHGTELRTNDGVATVESAKWGSFRGCIPADHLDQVGQINDEGTNTRTGFNHLRFYRNVAFELAAFGF